MEKKTKLFRIGIHTLLKAEELSDNMGIKIGAALDILVEQGRLSIEKNGIKLPLSNIKTLTEGGESASKMGTNALNLYLTGLSPQEEQRVKYLIKGWRGVAELADGDLNPLDVAGLMQAGNEMCLQGKTAFDSWYESIGKDERKAIKHELKHWQWQANVSDTMLRIVGARPTEMRARDTFINAQEDDES